MKKIDLTPDKIALIEKKLKEKPTLINTISKKEAIAQLSDTIRELQAKGYDFPTIAQMLTTEGLQISPSTLKAYMPKQQTDTPPARPPRKSAPKNQTGEQTEVINTATIAATITNDEQSVEEGTGTFSPAQDHEDI